MHIAPCRFREFSRSCLSSQFFLTSNQRIALRSRSDYPLLPVSHRDRCGPPITGMSCNLGDHPATPSPPFDPIRPKMTQSTQASADGSQSFRSRGAKPASPTRLSNVLLKTNAKPHFDKAVTVLSNPFLGRFLIPNCLSLYPCSPHSALVVTQSNQQHSRLLATTLRLRASAEGHNPEMQKPGSQPGIKIRFCSTGTLAGSLN